MHLSFSKRILENYSHPAHGYFERCSVYAVHSQEAILGTFLLGEKVVFIDFEQTSLRIDISHFTFKSDKYEIIDRKNETKIGEYTIPVALSGMMKPGTLILHGKEYACKKLKPDIPYSLFQKNTWGHFKVKVFDEKEEVIYKLKVNIPLIAVPNISLQPFDGEVQSNTTNLPLLFCGLFLLEQAFEIKDNQMS